jgi:hypothetical protein
VYFAHANRLPEQIQVSEIGTREKNITLTLFVQTCFLIKNIVFMDDPGLDII